MRTNFQPASQHLNTGAQDVVPTCAVDLSVKTVNRLAYSDLLSYIGICFGPETNMFIAEPIKIWCPRFVVRFYTLVGLDPSFSGFGPA
jgi:hypothetical protein